MAASIYDLKRHTSLRRSMISAYLDVDTSKKKKTDTVAAKIDTTVAKASPFPSHKLSTTNALEVSTTPGDRDLIDKMQLFPKIELFEEAKPLHVAERPKRYIYIPQNFGFSLPKGLIFENLLEPIDVDVIFYFSNEKFQALTLTLLSMKDFWPAPSNGALVGFSTLFNLDLICARKSKIAFFCDLSSYVFRYYLIIQETIKEAQNRYDFVRLIVENLLKNGFLCSDAEKMTQQVFRGVFLTRKNLSELNKEPHMSKAVSVEELTNYFLKQLKTENSWLSTDDNYNFVRDLYLDNKIFHLPLDAKDKNGNFEILSKWITSHGYKVDTLYISNIRDWLHYQSYIEAFNNNIDALRNDSTIIIDSHSLNEKLGLNPLGQRCFRGYFPHYTFEKHTSTEDKIKV